MHSPTSRVEGDARQHVSGRSSIFSDPWDRKGFLFKKTIRGIDFLDVPS